MGRINIELPDRLHGEVKAQSTRNGNTIKEELKEILEREFSENVREIHFSEPGAIRFVSGVPSAEIEIMVDGQTEVEVEGEDENVGGKVLTASSSENESE